MNVDQALAVADRVAVLNEPPQSNSSARSSVLEALDVLAEWVRAHRPVMPMAQRGRTVDHAVEVHQLDGAPVLVSLCGNVKPAPLPDAEPVELPAFDPHADDVCVSCCRRLPVELRPELPPRPKRERLHDRLSDVEVLIGETLADPVGYGGYMEGGQMVIPTVPVVTVRTIEDAAEIAEYEHPVTLAQINNDVRQYLRQSPE
jgi:hypothetical protein